MLGNTSLPSVVSFYCDISYILFITLFMILVIQLSSIYSFSHIIIVFTYYARARFLHFTTHYVTLWRPWICASRYMMFILLTRCSMRSYALREAWSFPLLFTGILIFLVFLFFSWFSIY